MAGKVENRNVHRILDGKPEPKRPLGTSKCKWKHVKIITQLAHLLTHSGLTRLAHLCNGLPWCLLLYQNRSLKIKATRVSIGPISVKVAGGKWLAVGNMETKLFFAGDVRNLLTS